MTVRALETELVNLAVREQRDQTTRRYADFAIAAQSFMRDALAATDPDVIRLYARCGFALAAMAIVPGLSLDRRAS